MTVSWFCEAPGEEVRGAVSCADACGPGHHRVAGPADTKHWSHRLPAALIDELAYAGGMTVISAPYPFLF